MPNTLVTTLALTQAFDRAMQNVLAGNTGDGSPRLKVTGLFMAMSLDHWQSVRLLFASDHHTSAFALLRCQFEATLKAFWFQYAATDEKVQRYAVVESENGVLKEPPTKTINLMVADLSTKAPAHVWRQLGEFNTHSLKQLHSYVHGGHYAAYSTAFGDAEEHKVKVLRLSNGLAGMVALLSATGTGDLPLAQRVIQVQMAHRACMPDAFKGS